MSTPPGPRRARIRAKLEAGELPRDLPFAAGFGRMLGIRYGISEGTVCSGCDEPIKAGERMVDYTYSSGRTTAFHEECGRVWEEERHRQ